jgi:hypothetical protein
MKIKTNVRAGLVADRCGGTRCGGTRCGGGDLLRLSDGGNGVGFSTDCHVPDRIATSFGWVAILTSDVHYLLRHTG